MIKLKPFLKMIEFSHTLFCLPFAYLGAFLAVGGIPTLWQLLWISIAMVSARTAAMCLNRIIDRHIDRANPRTADRMLATNEAPVKRVWVLVVLCLIILLYSASQLNELCLKLAPLAVIVLWLYPYTKRFTWLCHLILGVAIGIGPLGAAIAITGTFSWEQLFLAGAVAFWIAGFDIIYACQDMEFDRAHGLYSIPVRFGEKDALVFSAVLHIFTVAFFVATGLALNLGFVYYLGILFVSIVLSYEHLIVKPDDLSKVNFAALGINQYVGLIIFATTLIDILQ